MNLSLTWAFPDGDGVTASSQWGERSALYDSTVAFETLGSGTALKDPMMRSGDSPRASSTGGWNERAARYGSTVLPLYCNAW